MKDKAKKNTNNDKLIECNAVCMEVNTLCIEDKVHYIPRIVENKKCKALCISHKELCMEVNARDIAYKGHLHSHIKHFISYNHRFIPYNWRCVECNARSIVRPDRLITSDRQV
ncbi:MAG: hypothetical protein PHV20_00500 [Bacteroidales bacterium]|nr:hypothetical protein [Bacteroidales bacterium]